MYEVSNALVHLIKKKFGGVTPDDLLDDHTHASLKAEAKPVRRRFYAWCIPAWLLVSAGTALGLIHLRLRFDGPSVHPVLEEEPRMLWIGFPVLAAMGTLWFASIAEITVLPRNLKWNKNTWRRYYATEHGWLPGRSLLLNAVIWFPFLPLVGGSVWNAGERVDDSGIVVATYPFSRHIEPYSSVRAIELYQGVTAPLGTRMGENIAVHFASGSTWSFGPDPAFGPAPRDLAAHISFRSGIPISPLGMRR